MTAILPVCKRYYQCALLWKHVTECLCSGFVNSLTSWAWTTKVTPQVFVKRKWKTIILRIESFVWRSLVNVVDILTWWTLFTW